MSVIHRIVLGERRGLVREAFRALLDGHPEIEVIGESDDGVEVAGLSVEREPDVVLLGLSLLNQDGIETTREIKRRAGERKVIVLTEDASLGAIRSAFEAGADGFLMKSAQFAELETALARVRTGRRYLGPEATELVLSEFLASSTQSRHAGTPLAGLTTREVEVLRLCAAGKTSREMSAVLGISPRTADKHKANIMKKLDIHNTGALTAFAIRELTSNS